MNEIASSLEQEFADHAQTGREADITELQRIEAAGRGRTEIFASAIVFSIVFGLFGVLLLYAAFANKNLSSKEFTGFIIAGVVLTAIFAALVIHSRRPATFTLTESDIEVKGQRLPWESIEDYNVQSNSINGFTTATEITLFYVEGYTPPDTGRNGFRNRTRKDRKSGKFQTTLLLFVKARGMNGDKLAERVGEYFAAAHARAELRRLNAASPQAKTNVSKATTA